MTSGWLWLAYIVGCGFTVIAVGVILLLVMIVMFWWVRVVVLACGMVCLFAGYFRVAVMPVDWFV